MRREKQPWQKHTVVESKPQECGLLDNALLIAWCKFCSSGQMFLKRYYLQKDAFYFFIHWVKPFAMKAANDWRIYSSMVDCPCNMSKNLGFNTQHYKITKQCNSPTKTHKGNRTPVQKHNIQGNTPNPWVLVMCYSPYYRRKVKIHKGNRSVISINLSLEMT